MTSHDTTDAEHLPTQRRLLEPGSRRCQRLLDGLDREHGQVLQDDSTFASYLSDTDSFPGSIARSDERWQFLSLATGVSYGAVHTACDGAAGAPIGQADIFRPPSADKRYSMRPIQQTSNSSPTSAGRCKMPYEITRRPPSCTLR